MTDLARIRVQLTFPNGGPGVNTLMFSPGVPPVTWSDTTIDDLAAEVLTAWDTSKAVLSNQCTVSIDPVVDIIDHTTGHIIDQKTVNNDPGTVTGLMVSTHQSPAISACANFYTDRFIGGRRLRGRIFFGPLGNENINNLGGVGGPTIAAVEDMFDSLTSGIGPRLAVYHRPGTSSIPTGEYGDVIQVRVAEKPSFLRSRRT